MFILLAMTKKILKLKPALTKELDQNGWSLLHFAAYVGCDLTIVRQLLEQSDRDVVYLGVKVKETKTVLEKNLPDTEYICIFIVE